MEDFTNTKTAFILKSNYELHSARWLFKILSSSRLVNWVSKLTYIAIKLHLPIAWIIKPTLYRHFVGGETLEQCNTTISRLHSGNVYSILDYSVEGTQSPQGIEKAMKEITRNIIHASKQKEIPFAVFKTTAFIKNSILKKKSRGHTLNSSEQIQYTAFIHNINILCKTAFENNTAVLIDAEESWYQNSIDEVASLMMKQYNRERITVYNTLQMYRHDRLQYLHTSYSNALHDGYYLGVKLVRGAYMEKERLKAKEQHKPSPIHPTKDATDKAFDQALDFIIQRLNNISLICGTHNEPSTIHLINLMQQQQIEHNNPHIWFSQLYGMSDNISFNLASKGFNVVKYIPYGPVLSVLPYLIRRANENTAITGQTNRELQIIQQEILRRRQTK